MKQFYLTFLWLKFDIYGLMTLEKKAWSRAGSERYMQISNIAEGLRKLQFPYTIITSSIEVTAVQEMHYRLKFRL